MPHRAVAVAIAAALAALACGSAEPEPARDEVREPGQGSGGLLVEAFVKGEATADNASEPARYRTSVAVVVSRGGAPVADALVRVNERSLAHRGGGVYSEPARPGLPPELVVLSVRAGSHWLNGAVSSPGAHAFTRPARAGVALAAPFEVAWARGARADGASLDVSGFAVSGDVDDGRFTVPAGAPGLRPGSSAQCRLWRENRVPLRGGAPGSSLSVSVWNGLTVTVAAR